MAISQEVQNAIRNATRSQIESILESNGYQVYDHETTEELRQCLLDDVERGIIDGGEIDMQPERLMDVRDR